MAEFRVLVVEDEASARDRLVTILEGDGYEVRSVGDKADAVVAAEAFQPDLALLGRGGRGVDGVEVALRLRQKSNLPIIFVTGADSAQDIHAGFRIGADDYVLKPFDPEELSWRVRAVLRRSGHAVTERWEHGDLVVDEGAQLVTRAGARVALTATEFKLLLALVRNRRRVVPKAQLLRQVWGYEASPHLVEAHVSSLRRKLEAHGPRIISTVRGTGYLLGP